MPKIEPLRRRLILPTPHPRLLRVQVPHPSDIILQNALDFNTNLSVFNTLGVAMIYLSQSEACKVLPSLSESTPSGSSFWSSQLTILRFTI